MKVEIVVIFLVYVVSILSLAFIKTNRSGIKNLIRKGVHLLTGLILFYLTFHFDRRTLLIILIAGGVFSFTTYFIRRFNFIHTTSPSSLGTLFYPVGIIFSFLLLYELPIEYFQISLLLLSVSDTLANLGGYISKNNVRFNLLTEEKSLWGIVFFSLSAVGILILLLPETSENKILYTVLVVLLAIGFEVVSHRGSDNLTLPLGCSLFFLYSHSNEIPVVSLIFVVVLVSLGTLFLFKKGLITRAAGVAVYFLGIYYIGILGYQWSIPIVFFFLSSLLFTKINSKRIPTGPDQRNIWQVTANVFFALVFSILYMTLHQEIFIFLYTVSIAAVTADTWASELGPIFHQRSYSLLDGRLKESGTPGGISPGGTLAALAGSVVISMLAYLLFFRQINIAIVLLLSLSGFLSSMVDSTLSAFVEPAINKMSFFEENHDKNRPTPNDVINTLASGTASLVFLILWWFIA